jgi:AAA+ ATPase superfamily predicted ATPase
MASKELVLARSAEVEILNDFFNSKKPEFLALYGRRRVGKTYLIRNYFKSKSCIFFNSTGVYKESLKTQLKEFTKVISQVFYQGTEIKEKGSWLETFELLTEVINKQVPKDKKVVLFFDEFPWMASPKSNLLQALDYYWNRYWSEDSRIKLIVCGSVASWIIRNIVNNKTGLHNRITRTIRLDPMDLKDSRLMLKNMGVFLNENHVLQIYMMTGGIPYYLSQVTSGLSSSQVIEKLAFTKNSMMLEEFNKLYSSLFENAELYIDIVRAIASSRSGLQQDDIFKKIGESRGGHIARKLEELEDAGFIISFKPFKHKKRGVFYKVIDEYTLFYFQWIEPIKETVIKKALRKGYWDKIMQSPSWHSWAGYSFESICFKHLGQIANALSLSPTAVPSAWQYRPTKGTNEDGAQIDLLFDRDDDAITICEIKFTNAPFGIDKGYAKALQKKIEIFKKKTKTEKQIFLAMISVNGIKDTVYSEDMVDGVVTLGDLFKA